MAEFIVASAIEVLEKPREEWDAYDLIAKSGLKIEIKSSSYLQSWEQSELSKIIFGIVIATLGPASSCCCLYFCSRRQGTWNAL